MRRGRELRHLPASGACRLVSPSAFTFLPSCEDDEGDGGMCVGDGACGTAPLANCEGFVEGVCMPVFLRGATRRAAVALDANATAVNATANVTLDANATAVNATRKRDATMRMRRPSTPPQM